MLVWREPVETFRKAAMNAAGPLSIIGTIGGFVGDVLTPLGDFAPWVALISLLGASVVLVRFLAVSRAQGHYAWDTKLAGLLLILAGSAIVFSGWSLVLAAGPERGYLAENVEPIAQIQAQLLGIQEDVAAIRETTDQTATQVALIATVQAQGFADIQASFAQLQGSQALVPHPVTPQDWYNNARQFQLRGDTANAIKAYEGYFTFKLDYIDPFLEYTALLKATEGIARTRQIIGDMLAARPDSLTLDLISARLLDTSQDRLSRLEALAARAPQYGPVFYELGQEYDRALASAVTSDLMKRQSDAYNTLFNLEGQQGLSRYYIDKQLADAHLEQARKMLAAFAQATTTFSSMDIQIDFFHNGVRFLVVFPESFNAQKLLFSIDDPDPQTDAGTTGSGAQRFVNTLVGPVPLPVGEHTFYVRYVDATGKPSQVFNKQFRVDPIAITFQQQPMDFSTNAIPGLFSLGVVGTQGFEPYTFAYSLDSPALDNELKGVAIMPISIANLQPGEHVLYVQATAQDGTKTPVVQFAFTVKK